MKKNKKTKIKPMKIDRNNLNERPVQMKLNDNFKNDKKIKPSKIFENFNKKEKIKKSTKNGSI